MAAGSSQSRCIAVLAGLRCSRAVLSHSGDNWGGPGGSITVGIVGNVPAIPLPHPEVESPNRVVDESKGLFKAEPPKIEAAPPDAAADSEIRDATSRQIRDAALESSGESRRRRRRMRSLRRRRHADVPDDLVCDGRGHDAGRA